MLSNLAAPEIRNQDESDSIFLHLYISTNVQDRGEVRAF